ncbi:MAG TPA: KpsF/GutQ family sugar-phosphate isomerase [Armatimonadetes bacterium]|nr:KpsF/GutQ family sugar-phosphate isomerase [Armatimonadota bacterium]
MYEAEEILATARQVLQTEAAAIKGLLKRLGGEFVTAARLILESEGRVIVTGMGKSGTIGRKIAATLSSTGTPALFLSPAEGVHGDVGMVMRGEVVLALSYSGETEELLRILPALKRLGVRLIALTGRPNSTLARHSDVVLNVHVEREACPHNLSPTASTTAMLALGDALAMALMQARNFSPADFARFHPGGSLGRRLLLTVAEVMRPGSDEAKVRAEDPVKKALFVMTAAPIRGVVNVVDEEGKLVGIFTDGDLRRQLDKNPHVLSQPMHAVMTRHPTVITADRLATEALRLMQDREFDNLPVVDEEGHALGVIDVQDLLRAGIV